MYHVSNKASGSLKKSFTYATHLPSREDFFFPGEEQASQLTSDFRKHFIFTNKKTIR